MKRYTIGGLALLSVFLFAEIAALAEEVTVPAAINYQGKLTNPSDGKPVQAGVYHIEFRVWSDPTDTAEDNLIWGRVFAVHVMTNGIFNLLITDDGTPVTSPTPQTNDLKQAFQGEDRYLGLTITHGPNGAINAPEISPRQRMVSSPFAFHAQNATHAFEAEQADEAANAQDSEKLGGTPAKDYYDNARFIQAGGGQGYNTFMGWNDLGIAHGMGIYEYSGRYCIGGVAEDPGLGVKLLVKDEKIKAREGIVAEGPITPAPGKHKGIIFPDNIGTGTGDGAGIDYYVASGTEDCNLRIYVTNDAGDSLSLEASGDVEIKAGGKIKMKGRTFGSMTLVHNFFEDGDTFEVNAPSDGFYYINADAVAFTVELGQFSWYLRAVNDDDHNIQLQTYPIAKGEHFKAHKDQNLNGDSHFKVYWRPFGQ